MQIYDFVISCLGELKELLLSINLTSFFATQSQNSSVTLWAFFGGVLGGRIVFEAMWERWKK